MRFLKGVPQTEQFVHGTGIREERIVEPVIPDV